MYNDYEANQSVAAAILRDHCWEDQSFKRGDHVVLLDGAVVGVHASAHAAINELRRLEPNFQRGMVVKVEPVVADIIRWSRKC